MRRTTPSDAVPEDILYSPQQVSSMTVAAIEERCHAPNQGVKTHIATLDKIFIPGRPGDLITVLGRPANYKTGLIAHILAHETSFLRTQQQVGSYLDYINVYITLEISLEEYGMLDLSRQTGINTMTMGRGLVRAEQWDDLLDAAVNRASDPLWVIGHSMLNHRKRPTLSLNTLATALDTLQQTYHKRFRLVAIDYLQRIGADTTEQSMERRMQIDSYVNRIKNMALYLDCPVLLGCQAGRQVDERVFKLPGMADGQESSSIEHVSDKIISVWLPKTSEPAALREGKKVPGYGRTTVTEQLLLVGLAKQRYGIAPRIYPCDVDYATGEIVPLEEEET